MDSLTHHFNAKRKAIGFLRAGQLQEAKSLFKEVLKKDRHDMESLYYLGSIYGRLGMYKQAESYCRRLIGVQPAHPGGCLNLGLSLLHQNKYSVHK